MENKFEHLEGIYDDIPEKLRYENRKELHGIVSKNNFDFICAVNKSTLDILGDEWTANIKRNKKYWKKHGKVRDMLGLGRNKAVIGIGAGPSYKKNVHVLKKYVIEDGVKPWEDREFITIAANHQFKPLLKEGIIPDFVLLVDAAHTLTDQLITGIPDSARNTQLITGIHASPEILRKWDAQGRGIVFYTTPADLIQNAAKKYGYRRYAENKLELGGNVLNGAFMIGTAIFQSSIFMGVANDLSFEIKDDVDEQRKSYYADGDYSTNAEVTGSGRDEGKSMKRWAGYKMERNRIITLNNKDRYNFELDIVGTSHTLWVYKTWLETTMMQQTQHPVELHYFNCTEGGILGVMARNDEDKEVMRTPENWYFLDEVCINKHTGKQMYMTAMLEDAIKFYLKARRSQKWHCQDVQYATGTGLH
jgi:hypothetical protein